MSGAPDDKRSLAWDASWHLVGNGPHDILISARVVENTLVRVRSQENSGTPRLFTSSRQKEEKWRFLKDALWGGGGTHRSWPGGRGGRPRALVAGEGCSCPGKGLLAWQFHRKVGGESKGIGSGRVGVLFFESWGSGGVQGLRFRGGGGVGAGWRLGLGWLFQKRASPGKGWLAWQFGGKGSGGIQGLRFRKGGCVIFRKLEG